MQPTTAWQFIATQFGELAILFQRATDAQVSHHASLREGDGHEVLICVEAEDHQTAFYAGVLAQQVLNAALSERSLVEWDMNGEVQAFFDFAAPRALDPNTRMVLNAAKRHCLPVLDLEQEPFSATRADFTVRHALLQLGLCARQHRFLAAMPQARAVRLPPWIYRREAVMLRLQEHDVPVPRQDMEFPNKNRYSRVLRAAERIGFPVVLKAPESGAFHDALPAGGVIGPIRNVDQLEQAYRCGFTSTRSAWVESFVAGTTYRFLIMGREVTSVVRLQVPVVEGDGAGDVRALVARRARSAASFRERMAWMRLLADGQTSCRLALAGMSTESIPDSGVAVGLDFCNVALTTGECGEMLGTMPEVFCALACRAAAACELDYAGVDIVVADLTGSAIYPNAAVVSVKPEPDLRIHGEASPGMDFAGRLVREHFPARDDALVPIVAVTGTNGKTTTSRMTAGFFRHIGKRTGLACSDGVYVDGVMQQAGDLAGIAGAMMLYPRAEIDALVLESARGGLITLGRPFETCDVGICLNVAADHIGKDGVGSIEELAAVKRQVVEHARRAAVLNAEDPQCIGMVGFVSAPTLILFSGKQDSVRIPQHIASGGKAVYVRGDGEMEMFVYFDGAAHVPIVKVVDVPATMGGNARHNIENAAAAIAAACGMDLPLEDIRSAIRGFHMGVDTTPNRLNEFPGKPYRVLVDAAHNLHGLNALMAYMDRQTVPGKRTIVFGPSSRFPESDVRGMARLISTRFDRFICKKYRVTERHSTCIEPWNVLSDELERLGVPRRAIQVVPDPREAIGAAFEGVAAGDLLLILVPAGRSLELGVFEEIQRLTSG